MIEAKKQRLSQNPLSTKKLGKFHPAGLKEIPQTAHLHERNGLLPVIPSWPQKLPPSLSGWMAGLTEKEKQSSKNIQTHCPCGAKMAFGSLGPRGDNRRKLLRLNSRPTPTNTATKIKDREVCLNCEFKPCATFVPLRYTWDKDKNYCGL